MNACPSCHAEIEPGAELCMSCGEPIEAAPPPPVRAAQPPARPTMAATPGAKRRVVEPEAVRCPGCGSPSKAARCPGCGAVLRHDD